MHPRLPSRNFLPASETCPAHEKAPIFRTRKIGTMHTGRWHDMTTGFSTRPGRFPACSVACIAFVVAHAATAFAGFTRVEAVHAEAAGSAVPGAGVSDRIVLANEPGVSAGAVLEFDLSKVGQKMTPLARLPLDLEKLKVRRPGEKAGVERGVIHVYALGTGGDETLVGSSHLKPGGDTASYTLDVTSAANSALAMPVIERTLRLALRLEGKPASCEVYALPRSLPVLEIASAENWTDDWEKAAEPVTSANEIYRESCLALADEAGAEVVLKTLYPVKRVSEVISLGTGAALQEGKDWILRDGRIVLPPGSAGPVHIATEFFVTTKKNGDGTETSSKTTVKLVAGSWYHQQQIAVSYTPAERDWKWPEAKSTLDQLPRTKELLSAGKPVSLIVFGDSISEGFDSSKKNGVWPFMPGYGELVARALESKYGAKVTSMNHARAGGTASHATTQADSQVAWFKPDLVLLAYGMNDRGEDRRVAQRKNLEQIIDTVRARSPGTEFIVITPMLNNPRQPTGLDPIKFIRDEELAIDRPRVAFVDITSTQLAMLDRKDYLDLSGNGANHPNDFLQRIYAQRILEVLAP